MVHARVSDEYLHLELMYTADHIFTVIPMKYFVNQDNGPTRPQKLANGTKPSVYKLPVLFFTCVVKKAAAQVDTKALNMRHK